MNDEEKANVDSLPTGSACVVDLHYDRAEESSIELLEAVLNRMKERDLPVIEL